MLTLVSVLLWKTASPCLHAYLKERNVDVKVCFIIICLILQIINYWGNVKFVLFVIECHDGIIMNLINLFASYTYLLFCARSNGLISFMVIASWHWTRTRAWYSFCDYEPIYTCTLAMAERGSVYREDCLGEFLGEGQV